MRCESCGHADHRGLVLDADKKLVCGRCSERERHKRERLDAAVRRKRVLAIDLNWCHEADRKAVGRLISRRAAITPAGPASILRDLAAKLTTRREVVHLDLTSVSADTEREVATELTDMLECEVITAGPHRDTLVAILGEWNAWRRAA